MDTATSKLTKKYQATIPEPVRRQLQLSAGDAIAFDMDGDGVYLRKARPTDVAFMRGLEDTLALRS